MSALPFPSARLATLAAAAVCLVAIVGCRRPEPERTYVRPVRALKVGDSSLIVGRRFPGTARATQEVDLAFRVGGEVQARPVDVGDVVRQGDVVALLDPRDFEVNVRAARARLDEAKAQLLVAEQELAAARTAHERGAVTEVELLRRVGMRDSNSAQVESAQAALDTANDALADASLRAPFDGTIVATYVESFENVRQKQPIVRLLDQSKIEMVVDIPEHLISYAPMVTDVNCSFEALPGVVLKASIKEIGTEASRTTRTFPVTLIMEQPEGRPVLPGMTGEAWGSGAVDLPDLSGFEIPLTAVRNVDGAQPFIWVIEEGVVHRRDVAINQLTANGVQIADLEPGLWIAIAGVHYLEEGQQVTILGSGDTGGAS